MAKASMALAELVEKGSNDDVIRELLAHVVQRLMDFEQRCGAGYGDRRGDRLPLDLSLLQPLCSTLQRRQTDPRLDR